MLSSLGVALLSFTFFFILLASGVFAFGTKTGSPARGAVIPLLLIPLVEDWIRFAANVSFKTAWLLALITYGILAIISFLRLPPSQRNPLKRISSDWWTIAFLLFFAHIILRTWFFTGSAPNPADDIYAGYKASSLFHATGWPAPHPEAPELPFSYFYFVYSWPAALTSWLGVNLWAGWWVTAVVISTVGCLLIFEIIKPRITSWKWSIPIALFLINGASFAIILAAVLHLPPKFWGGELKMLLPPGLYLKLPTYTGIFWNPYNYLCTGVILTSVHLILQQWRHRMTGGRTLLLALSLGSLPGYCTFYLLGFIGAVAPALLVVLFISHSRHKWLRATLFFFVVGVISVSLSFPFLYELSLRAPGVRNPNFTPLLTWLTTPNSTHSAAVLIKLVASCLLFWILTNPLGILGLLSSNNRRPWMTWTCATIFLWGTLFCALSPTDDFTPKFGSVVTLAGAFLFLQSLSRPRWQLCIFFLALIGPTLGILNNIRANFQTGKLDPVWKAIDQYSENGQIPIFYHANKTEWEQRTPWINIAPFYSCGLFITPAGQVDETGRNFLRNIADQSKLGDPMDRLKKLRPEATHYLLLTFPNTSEENILYRSVQFQLQLKSLQ